MIRRLGFFCAVAAAAAFGMDVYPPAREGALELRAGVVSERIKGVYDEDGELVTWDDFGLEGFDPVATGVPFQIKYGFAPGLDVEVEWQAVFTNEDAGDQSGMDQPEIGIKYLDRATGRGLFVNYTAPFATGDFSDTDPVAYIEVGGLLLKRKGELGFRGLASYAIDFEGNAAVRLLLRPEFYVQPKAALYLTLEHVRSFSKGESGFLTLLEPGLFGRLSETVTAEIALRLPMAGESAPAVSQFRANLYFALQSGKPRGGE